MHLIVCVDDRYGMSFCGRRLSRDVVLIEHILHLTSGSKLWIHPASAGLFPEKSVVADPAFFEKSQHGDFCFAETTPIPTKIADLESVILYRWNRSYPSTMKFPQELLRGMHLLRAEDFPGNSHEKIIMEQYIL